LMLSQADATTHMITGHQRRVTLRLVLHTENTAPHPSLVTAAVQMQHNITNTSLAACNADHT
jgi:hypothetical protein